MWRNYLKIAFRNIQRSKGYAFINIGGLGIGIASLILILVWIKFELSIDRFYTHSDRVPILNIALWIKLMPRDEGNWFFLNFGNGDCALTNKIVRELL